MSIFTFSLFMQNIFSLWLINLLIFHNLLILMHHRPAAGSCIMFTGESLEQVSPADSAHLLVAICRRAGAV